MGAVKNAFHDEINSATCLECKGEGEVLAVRGFGSEADGEGVECDHCHGEGYCDCEECVETAAENAFSDMCESEPPLSMDERHQMAWREKQELRR